MKLMLTLMAIATALSGCQTPTPTLSVPVVDTYQPVSRSAQIEEVREGVMKYQDYRVAQLEGWKAFGGDEPLMGTHYYSEAAPDYVAGDTLDFSRPNNLMYTMIDGRNVLTGVAFVVRLGEGEPVPAGFAGGADRWHVHDFVAAIEAATEERPFLGWLANRWLDANYRNKGDNRGRLAMVHVWVSEENPDGIFAHFDRTIPYRKLGLPDAYWSGASEHAARGLNLSTEGGCAAVDGTLWIATVSRAQERAIDEACAQSAELVRSAIATGSKRDINAAGERAWMMFDRTWQSVLTPVQRNRIAAMSEHGSDGHRDGHNMR